jgi:nucleoside-diphosphate-sugar epimerase
MRVFVARATGVIGQHLVPRLVTAQPEVIVHRMSWRDGFPAWVKAARAA